VVRGTSYVLLLLYSSSFLFPLFSGAEPGLHVVPGLRTPPRRGVCVADGRFEFSRARKSRASVL
jgi:hypothetical protein